VVRVGLRHAALRLLNELLRRRFIGPSRRYVRSAGFGRSQSLIVDLLRYFPPVDQQFVAMEIVLRLYIVGLGGFQLGMGGGKLLLGSGDAGVRVFDARCSEPQLTRSIY
jgi:hypothetical protein